MSIFIADDKKSAGHNGEIRTETYRYITTAGKKTDSKGVIVHIQIINFRLENLSEEDYRRHCDTIAPALANLPGLVSKAWLANSEMNTYGGVYVWRDREAMEDYKRTDIYKGMLANPNLGGVMVKDFAILENPTRATRGLLLEELI